MWIRRRSELLVCAILALCATASGRALAAPSDDSSFAQYRDRFKQGLDRYNDGAFAEAIVYWEPIYRALGEREGYRLAYDLGVAYMELGDATHAAERLQTFLAAVDERRQQGESPEPVVLKEQADARVRVSDLTARMGRIRIDASNPPAAVKVDAADPRLAGFVAWVTPGSHVVVFAPGTPDEDMQTITVYAGQMVPATPTRRALGPAAAPTPTPTPAPAPAPTPGDNERRGLPGAALPSLQLVILSGGITLATGAAAIALDLNAASIRNHLVDQWNASGSISLGDRGAYDTARTGAYVAIGCAAGLAALTAGLVTWYVVDSARHEPAVRPVVGLGQVGLAGRF
jgi:hypothetical protein